MLGSHPETLCNLEEVLKVMRALFKNVWGIEKCARPENKLGTPSPLCHLLRPYKQLVNWWVVETVAHGVRGLPPGKTPTTKDPRKELECGVPSPLCTAITLSPFKESIVSGMPSCALMLD